MCGGPPWQLITPIFRSVLHSEDHTDRGRRRDEELEPERWATRPIYVAHQLSARFRSVPRGRDRTAAVSGGSSGGPLAGDEAQWPPQSSSNHESLQSLMRLWSCGHALSRSRRPVQHRHMPQLHPAPPSCIEIHARHHCQGRDRLARPARSHQAAQPGAHQPHRHHIIGVPSRRPAG